MPKKSISRKGSDAGASGTIGDLTARASEGQIDPVVGQEVEVQRIFQIVCRKTKKIPFFLVKLGLEKLLLRRAWHFALQRQIVNELVWPAVGKELYSQFRGKPSIIFPPLRQSV
ncbi:uncharacterized protein LOC106752931 [Vigna radiata var. radiata]|uniref:Uncharacterized protein LOC106752931 n=1 Tax=Vigna radiata var. radiata TaxID=3916 RepID=A0A3Q0F0K6_VIGRR|nr:uncharacterized protein LOC106752931 [Vigna radiata var. radiata]